MERVALPILTFPIETLSFAGLDVGLELPAPPPSPSFDAGVTDFSTIVRSKAPTYTKPVFTAPEFPSIDTISLPEPPVPFDIGTIPDGQSNQAGSNLANYITPVMSVPEWGSLDTSISEEDVEVAGIKLNKIQAQISVYTSDLQEAVNKFNQ